MGFLFGDKPPAATSGACLAHGTAAHGQPVDRPSTWTNRALFRLLWPLAVEQILTVTMGIADTAMVSSVGEFAVSGVALVDQVAFLLITVFAALASGGSVVVSQYIGRGDDKNASLSACQLVYINLAVSIVLMMFCLALCRPVIRVIYGGIEPDVFMAAVTYFWLSALSYPFLALYNAAAAILRAVKKTRSTMVIALMVNLLNVGGNIILIFGFRAGVAGAAIATVVARAAAAAVALWMLRRPGLAVSLRGLFSGGFSRNIVFSILGVGVPGGIENSMFQVGKIAVARIITTFGTAAIAANAVSGVVNSFSYMTGQAFSLAMLTVTGQCAGAQNYPEAKRLAKKILFWSHCAVWTTSALIMLFIRPITGIFSLSDESAAICRTMLIIYAVFAGLAWPPSFCLPSALRAAGDARYCMICSAITMFVVRVSSSFLFCYTLKLGAPGVYYAMGCDFVMRGLLFTIRWRSGRWMTKRVIRE